MQKFATFTGLAAPLLQANIDTDQIIPKQFLTRIERTGYGAFLFNDWRCGADGTARPEFVLNRPEYKGASILIAGPNFGCGSSREHAAWSLMDFGFRAVIAPSFGDIFYNNSLKNGLLPIRLDTAAVDQFGRNAESDAPYQLSIDLVRERVSDDLGFSVGFEMDDFRRNCLIEGLDDIALTLRHQAKIDWYEDRSGAPHRFAVNTSTL